MSSGDGAPGSYPARAKSKSGATLALNLLHGTLASLRCRELLDQGCHEAARHELLVLRSALEQLATMPLDPGQAKEAQLLRSQEERLIRAMLDLAGRERDTSE